MRGNIVGLLAAALMGVCGVASANIIYNVDISGGGETVTGTITTNGTLGVLTDANIVAWNLTATGQVDLSVVSPGNEACESSAFGGCGVTAEPDGILSDTGVVGAFLAFYGGDFFDSPAIVFFPSGVDVFPVTGQAAIISEHVPYAIGTAPSVPEPPTAILLAIGLVGLASVYMRARGRQSAAV
jgi:hypothetical protein